MTVLFGVDLDLMTSSVLCAWLGEQGTALATARHCDRSQPVFLPVSIADDDLVGSLASQHTAQIGGYEGEWQCVSSYWILLSPCGLDLCGSHLALLLAFRVCVPQASESGALMLVMKLRFLLACPTI